jgi:hypothetical protein
MTQPESDALAPPPEPSWERSVEAELTWLRAEVERMSHELLKLGGRVNVLMQERAEAKGRGQAHAHRRR